MFKLWIYYELGTDKIIDYFPKSEANPEIIKNISIAWNNPILKEILKYLSEENPVKLSDIKKRLNHSLSTIYDAINKLERLKLIKTEVIYEGKKQRIIQPLVLFVNENPKFKKLFKNLLSQGLWIDTEKLKKIINFLKEHSKEYFTAEEIALKTKIPVDEVKNLLESYDSFITRAMSEAFKEPPFEKITMYKYRERKNNLQGNKGS